MSDDLKDLVRWTVGINVVVGSIIYASMAIFVLWLDYDYVTTSSILFSVFLTLLLAFIAIGMLAANGDGEAVGLVPGSIFVAVAVLLVAVAVTAGLGVFAALHHPDISKETDIVARFWSVLGAPFVWAWKLVGALLPAAAEMGRKALAFVDLSSATSNALGGLISTTLAALILRGRFAPTAVKAAA